MQSKPQLFCYTYAGGNAGFFDVIDGDLADLDVIKPEYAGHGERRKEPFYHDFTELADDMYAQLKECWNGEDYALFGYSMGSISVVEILKRIIDRREIRPPVCVFLAAHEPISKNEYLRVPPDKRDEWAKQRTIDFGAVPEKLLDNRSFWRTYLPLYLADYALIGTYRFEDSALQTNIPAHVFYSETDTRREDMLLWKNIFTGECDFHRFDGNHFFIRQHHAAISSIILAAMSRS